MGIVTWGSDPGLPGVAVWTEELDREGAEPDPRDPSVMQQARMRAFTRFENSLLAYIAIADIEQLLRGWADRNPVNHRRDGGLPAAVAVLGGVGIVLWRVVLGLRRDPDAWGRLATVLPPVTFLVHNVFDFSAYLPSLLISCAALWALAMRPGSPTVPAPAPPDPMPFPRKIALGLLLAGAASWGLREAAREYGRWRRANRERMLNNERTAAQPSAVISPRAQMSETWLTVVPLPAPR